MWCSEMERHKNEQTEAKCMAVLRCRKERHAQNKHHEGKNTDVEAPNLIIAYISVKPSAPPEAFA